MIGSSRFGDFSTPTQSYDIGILSFSRWRPPKPRAASRRPLVEAMGPASALGELLAASRLVQADFLALDLARIAGHEAGLGKRRLQLSVVIHQRPGDAVPHRACLTGLAAAANV